MTLGNCSGPLSEGLAQRGRFAHQAGEGFEDGAPLFAGTRDDATDVAEVLAVVCASKCSTDFLSHFHRAHVSFGLVVVAGIETGIQEVSQDLLPAFPEPIK